MYIKLIVAVFFTAILSACSAGGQPSPLMSGGQTIQPNSPSTALDQPGNGPTKSIGTPVPGWENIPIMPGAYAGELEDMVYLYSVDETIDKVEEYYQSKMDVNGWSLTNRQVLETSSSSGPSTILDFRKNDQTLNVMLVTVPEENSTAVILSQIGP